MKKKDFIMEKKDTKNCLFWFSTTLISTIIAALFGLLAIATDFPDMSKLLIGFLASLLVMFSLLWGAHTIKELNGMMIFHLCDAYCLFYLPL
ncbi:hypothetical protein GGI1_19454, partial [Acidithiobacillus sp. GGI-221]